MYNLATAAFKWKMRSAIKLHRNILLNPIVRRDFCQTWCGRMLRLKQHENKSSGRREEHFARMDDDDDDDGDGDDGHIDNGEK